MTKQINKLALAIMMLFTAFSLSAQVTTAGISGKITTNEEAVIGATIVATHTPSGTTYGTVSNVDGRYNISGMRVGGPYEVRITYVGYQTVLVTGINLNLGETELVSAKMTESSTTLQEAVVEAKKNVAKNSTITNIGADQLQKVPTISRSINDFTKLSPFAGSGNSFAGRDGRYNTITLDGASLNNNFGLSSKNLPGGDAQPISLDAIDEISVNVSPYDVKYSNFTGASVNVVTKAGTNKLKGSAYTFQRPKSFTGNRVDTFDVVNANSRSAETYGFTLGAPIIKNKLFVFVSAEFEKESYPGVEWSPSTDGVIDLDLKISRTTEADLLKVSNYLKDNYAYEAGKYKDWNNFSSRNYKIMTRLDWNINDMNKFMLRFNAVESSNDQQTNATSAPFTRGTGRISKQAISFDGAHYGFKNTVTSLTGELNTKINSTMSNKLLATYTHIQDARSERGNKPFPFVDIWEGGDQYMSFGTELFTPHNNVINNVTSIINNFNLSLNQHFITVGASFEHQYFINQFMRYGYGYYKYNSVNDFMTDAKPAGYALTYGYNGVDAPGAELNFGMAGLYGQDEWYVNDNFRLTYGIRFDMPMYMDDMLGNSAINALTFADDRKIDVSQWPTTKILLSPRVGFRWDMNGDKSVVLNGGTGIFTGLLPFVWFTNQPTNAGVIQNTVSKSGSSLPNDFKFTEDFRDVLAKYPDLFPSTSNTLPGSIAFVDPEFKLPQVWRTSFGADIELPMGFDLTLNALYTKDLINVTQKNVNEKVADGAFTGSGNDKRAYFTVNSSSARRINPTVSDAMMLTNGDDKGYQFAFNVALSKRLFAGFTGMVSYTYTAAEELTTNPGSQAYSAWSSNVAVGSLNDPGLSYSGFAVPHRIISSLSYELNILEKYKTTFSLFYSGTNQGRISYTSSNDLNWDGISSDLIYVPATEDELTFVDNGTYTAAQQKTDFWNYINNNEYLSSRKGMYAERFGDLRPWLNRFDLKIAENFDVNVASQKIGIELSLNTLNIGNMINPAWGTYETMGVLSYDNVRPIKLKTITAGVPSYQLNATSTSNFVTNTTWKHNVSTGSTWGMIVGLKVTF